MLNEPLANSDASGEIHSLEVSNTKPVIDTKGFQGINKAYNSVFTYGKLSVGLVIPLENYAQSSVPSMQGQLQKIQLAEQLGFSAVWLRDVPFNVPSFGDAGQIFDPFVYLGFLAGQTSKIALGVSSIILPLRHPAHVAKAAASVDVLSEGRLILGIASGDRPDEYPAFNLPYDNRGQGFRESYEYIRSMWNNNPQIHNSYGFTSGMIDLLPKPFEASLPMMITGSSRQSQDWIAKNGDGWMIYPREIGQQKNVIQQWRERVAQESDHPKPVMQPLYIDLVDKPDHKPESIHLGYRLGSDYLNEYLHMLEDIGVNHVALNLRFNAVDTELALENIATNILKDFEI